jgi:hypothetical protein
VKECDRVYNLIQEQLEKQNKLQPWENPVLLTADLYERAKVLNSILFSVFLSNVFLFIWS